MKNKKIIFLLFFLIFVLSIFSQKAKAEDLYDFKLEEIIVSPSYVAANQTCEIRVRVKNNSDKNIFTSNGLSSYKADFADFVKEDEILPSPTTNDYVGPNENIYYIFTGYFKTTGEKSLSFFVDSEYDVYEDDESNNEIAKNIIVYSPEEKDLSVEAIDIDSEDILINTDVKITVKVRNTGGVSFTNDFGLLGSGVEFIGPGFVKESSVFPEIINIENSFDPGEELEYIYYGQFNRQGEQKLSFYIDYNNVIDEAEENNNFLTVNPYVYINKEDRDNFEIFDIKNKFLSSSSTILSWKTSKETTSRVDFYGTNFNELTINKENVNSLEHEITIENLNSSHKYYYKVSSTNNSVTKTSDYFEFTMPENDEVSILDRPKAIITSDNNVQINWSTDVISQSYVYYKLNTGSTFKKKGSTSLVDEHIVDLGVLNPGFYQYYVVSTSTKMNTAYVADIKTFEIKEPEEPSIEDENLPAEETDEPVIIPSEDAPEIITKEYEVKNASLYNNLRGKIILRVEYLGEAYYIDPEEKKMYYLGRPADAFRIMREQGLGVSEEDYNSFYNNNNTAPARLSGKIILRVEKEGEAYYINPADLKMHYLGSPADAFRVMQELGLGISNDNFALL